MESDFGSKYRKYAFSGMVALTLIGAAYLITPFLPALMWAGVLTVLMTPLHKKYFAKRGPNLGATLTTFAAIFIVFIPLLLVTWVLFTEISGQIQALKSTAPAGQAWTPEYTMQQIDVNLKPVMERLGQKDFSAETWFASNRASITNGMLGFLSKAASNAGHSLFTLVVAFLTMFFMVRDGHKLKDPALDLIPLPKDRAEFILERMGQTIHAVFIGVVLVALIQGTLAGLGYWIAGVSSPIVWMLATIVLCAVPLLGAPIIYAPLSLILMAQGRWGWGIFLAVWGFLLVSNVDNILRPFIIGSRVKLHPMAIFFSLLGGVLAMGPVGIMAGPVLLTILLALQDIVRERLDLEEQRRAAIEQAG
ncbi:MAG: AI-2E family transporter [Fimbriimonadaceae bacterium]